jgi:hypothetical protein
VTADPPEAVSIGADDRQRMEADILGDVAELAREQLAGDSWARLMVCVDHDDAGRVRVFCIDVEGVTNDARVDAAFAPGRVGNALDALATATHALVALRGLDLGLVCGGTFVWTEAEGLAFLPGLVRAPSARVDRERDAVLERVTTKNRSFRLRAGLEQATAAWEVDTQNEAARFRVGERHTLEARATVLATYEPATCTFAWFGKSPEAEGQARERSAALIDELLERDAWELGAPSLQTDSGSAFALAAWVADRHQADALLRLEQPSPHGRAVAFVVIDDVREAVEG